MLNGHFSDSDGGADGTVGMLRLVVLYERFELSLTFVDVGFLNPASHVISNKLI